MFYSKLDKANLSKINGKPFITILSIGTDDIYMDEDACAYIFEKCSDAKQFVAAHAGTGVTTPGLIYYETAYWDFLTRGIKKVIINGNLETCLLIRENKQNKRYCNPELARDVIRLLETSDRKYLGSFKDREFIVPVTVHNIQSGVNGIMQPYIRYGCLGAGKGNEDLPVYYISFTDIDHFDSWVRKHGEGHKPLKVKYWQLMQIVGESCLCINPGEANTLFLSREELSHIKYEEPESIVS